MNAEDKNEKAKAREARARQRQSRAVLMKTTLRDAADVVPIRGAEAMSLATQLTRQSWRLAGFAEPTYSRETIPVRFVHGWPD